MKLANAFSWKIQRTMSRNPNPSATIRRDDVGELIRAWRTKRRLSQLTLALDIGVSARHLSFVETGRARPSPELLLSMSEHLDVPLRERNAMLLAAGYAPRFPETSMSSPDMASVQGALQRLLDAHDPYPGVALDRHWTVVRANQAARKMVAALPPFLTQPHLNIFRASLHPEGFAALTVNFDEWGSYLLDELQRLVAATTDPDMQKLAEEIAQYPNVAALKARRTAGMAPGNPLLVPCVMNIGGQHLSLFTTLATFGSPRDVTLAELTVELFYPADKASEELLRAKAAPAQPPT
jgi:transcriptional regulator with XRE-family HTH domain